jgi:ATP-dependent RNA helicase DeaD
MITSFDKLELNSNLIEGLKKEGISEPTDIQVEVIPLALENKDIIGQSQTGSGKTLAYLLPIFQKIDNIKKEMQTIILAPTHELVMQIDKEIKLLSENSNIPVTSVAIIGEVNIKRQIEKLKEKPHIVVGSAGRIFELIKMKKISAHTIKTIVIDEGDRLLDQNNLSVVKDVIKTTMRDRQLMVFSATINEGTLNIAKDLMKDVAVIKVEDKIKVNPNISHMYFTCEQRDKVEVLRKLVASVNPEKAIVFINKSEETQRTTLKLQYHHIKAYGIFGTASKEERKKAMEEFRSGKIQLLIASDVAARGLDIKGVTHIFNLDLPQDSKEYLHRVGRTGRAGESGTAISIVTEKETSLIKRYERDFDIKIEAKDVYKGKLFDARTTKPAVKNLPDRSSK